jgi:hypothetical protein
MIKSAWVQGVSKRLEPPDAVVQMMAMGAEVLVTRRLQND